MAVVDPDRNGLRGYPWCSLLEAAGARC
jgi:hypothetical protein